MRYLSTVLGRYEMNVHIIDNLIIDSVFKFGSLVYPSLFKTLDPHALPIAFYAYQKLGSAWDKTTLLCLH